MPHSKPFHWLLAVGMLCSLAGLAFTRFPGETGAASDSPTPDTSATVEESSGASNGSQTVVTEASPVGTPAPSEAAIEVDASQTAVVGVVATPTPALTAMPAASVQAIPSHLEQPTELQSFPDKAKGLLDSMNQARRDAGLDPLEWDASLETVAYARARNLVTNGYFDHYAPDGESAFSELAARGIRYRLAGENLARNNYVENRTVAAAFDGLMASPGHRANILEPRFSSVGVAAVRDGKMWIYVTVFLN
ncbi:MAG: CAP domain-containing protein [bacterium]